MSPTLPISTPFFLQAAPTSTFAVSLLTASLIAYLLIARGARHLSISSAISERIAGTLLLSAILGAHLFGAITDRGSALLTTPTLLFSTGSPLSSAGGFLGAGLVGALWIWHLRLGWGEGLALADVVARAFPFAWIVARAGCAIVHDHSGRLSRSPLAVPFPDGPRLDCGLLELLLTPLLIALAITLPRRLGPTPRPGLVAGSMAIAYAALRFSLDFLRATDLPGADPRYATLTAAQWGAFPLLLAGLLCLFRRRS